MSVSARMRRITLTATAVSLASAPLLASVAVAAPAESRSAEQSALLDHVPASVSSSCISAMDEWKAEGTLPAGVVDAVACPVNSSSGETVVAYIAFSDSATLQDAFISEIPTVPGRGNCADGRPGQGSYDQENVQDVGQWACFTASDGNQQIVWTHEPSQILAVLMDPQLDLTQIDQLWYGLGPNT